MKELRELKLHRIKMEFTNFIKSLSFESYIGINEICYYNSNGEIVITVKHNDKLIKVRKYLLPSCVHDINRNDILNMIYGLVGYLDYKIKLYHIDSGNHSLL